MASSHKPPNIAEPALPPSFRMQIAVAAAVAINARSESAPEIRGIDTGFRQQADQVGRQRRIIVGDEIVGSRIQRPRPECRVGVVGAPGIVDADLERKCGAPNRPCAVDRGEGGENGKARADGGPVSFGTARAKLAFRRISIIDKTPPAAWCRGNNRSKPLTEERGEVARRPKSQARNIRATRGADPNLRPLPQR